MCLYPRLTRNPKYKPNKTNGGHVPTPRDARALTVPIGCGICIECLNQKRSAWLIRLNEEIKQSKEKAWMVTLTFSEESLIKIRNKINTTEGNAIAKEAVKLFRERWRKNNKKSIKHWLTTEHGHKNTERIHLHGIIFTNINIREGMAEHEIKYNTRNTSSYLAKLWQYGNVHIGLYVSTKTINYIIKYVTKKDKEHPGYTPIILTSPGIGSNYTTTNKTKHTFVGNDTNTKYRLKNGSKYNLPTYYRNKLFSSEQKEHLWMNLLDKKERWVMGERIDISKSENEYYTRLKWAQIRNKEMGFDEPKEWKKIRYKASRELTGINDHLIDKNKQSIEYFLNLPFNTTTFEEGTKDYNEWKETAQDRNLANQINLQLFIDELNQNKTNLNHGHKRNNIDTDDEFFRETPTEPTPF